MYSYWFEFYVGLKFHQIMLWNPRWSWNCCKAKVTSETSRHGIPLNSPNTDTSTLWHKMWHKDLGGFNLKFKSELTVLEILHPNSAVVLLFARKHFLTERFCSFEQKAQLTSCHQFICKSYVKFHCGMFLDLFFLKIQESNP